MTNSAVVLVWNTNNTKDLTPFALKELLFTPAINWISLTLESLGYTKVIVHGEKELENSVLPKEFPLASGADLVNWLAAESKSNVLVLGADAPLIKPEDILEAAKRHKASDRKITLFADGERFLTGSGWYDANVFTELLKFFKDTFSLSDLLEEIKEVGYGYTSYIVETASILPMTSSINFNRLSNIARNRIIETHLKNNVDIPISDGIIIGPEVIIGEGTMILPNTIIKNKSQIGSKCEIGPNSVIDSSKINDDSKFISSHMEFAEIGSHTTVGPMSRVRPNSVIGNQIKIGNFVEIKNSSIGDKTAVSHLTYVGDSDVGSSCNIGCGVVTVNYDGKGKNRTTIKDNVFVGCNCNLIAPVTLENGSYAAAGTTITEDVPENSLVIGRSKQTIKNDWVK